MLNDFVSLKKKMESLSRYLSFLSIDIVDSTGIKAAEDKLKVQYTFLQYKKMVQSIFEQHSVVNSAWTPDGVMACFNSVDDSVCAAQQVLEELVHFNKEVKKIKRDFIVRCGINAGVVYYDEDLPLEEMTDKVIDVAGHMQKYANPGSIAISKPSIKPLDRKSGFLSTTKTVDGYKVYEFAHDEDPNSNNV